MKNYRQYILCSLLLSGAVIILNSCFTNINDMGTYGYDKSFLDANGIGTVELMDRSGRSKVLVSPSLQGRVMTSSADGNDGFSFGWINYKFVEAGRQNPQFNPFGGEERFWIGPEGGLNSWYFKEGAEQIYSNWVVPGAIDTMQYDVVFRERGEISFRAGFCLSNASGRRFSMGVRRTVRMLEKEEAGKILGTDIPEDVNFVAYTSENELKNNDGFAWTKETGMPSIWLLGCFNPTPTTVVFIPYNKDFDGKKVNDEYFGKIPSDRICMDDGILYFRIDGRYRSKLGLPQGSAKDVCGSYDYEKGVLTIIKYTIPDGEAEYVNGQWGDQSNPFGGDVINAYNDGPTEDGIVMGPFYEMETSSPAAALEPGETLLHVQNTMHFQGRKSDLEGIARKVFGVELGEISGIFGK